MGVVTLQCDASVQTEAKADEKCDTALQTVVNLEGDASVQTAAEAEATVQTEAFVAHGCKITSIHPSCSIPAPSFCEVAASTGKGGVLHACESPRTMAELQQAGCPMSELRRTGLVSVGAMTSQV